MYKFVDVSLLIFILLYMIIQIDLEESNYILRNNRINYIAGRKCKKCIQLWRYVIIQRVRGRQASF